MHIVSRICNRFLIVFIYNYCIICENLLYIGRCKLGSAIVLYKWMVFYGAIFRKVINETTRLCYGCIDNVKIIFVIYIYMKIVWKSHGLTNTLSWNVTKWGLFFNTVSFPVTYFFHRCCSTWIQLLTKMNRRYDVIIWTFQSTLVYT